MDAGRVLLRADGTGGRRAPGRGHAAGPTLSYYPGRLTVPVRRTCPCSCGTKTGHTGLLPLLLCSAAESPGTGAASRRPALFWRTP